MGLTAEIIAVPGMVDAGSAAPLSEAPYPGAVRDLLATPGIAGTGVERELRRALGQAVEDAGVGSRWWDALRRLLAPEHHTIVGEDQQVIGLDGYWMTLPEVHGATVKLTVTVEASTERSASFMIAGIGGGPQVTLKLKEGLVHETGACERVLLSAVATFQKIVVTRQGEAIATYPRLVAIDERHLEWSFHPDNPPAGEGLGDPLSSRGFDQSASEGSTTATLDIARGTVWEVSAGLTLANLGGLEAKVSAKVAYQQAVALEYRLPPGHRYLAARYAELPAYIWTVET